MADPDDQDAWAEFRRRVGERVRDARRARGLTQEGLADLSGVGRNTVQRIEWGDPEAPRLSALWRLAQVLETSVRELVEVDVR